MKKLVMNTNTNTGIRNEFELMTFFETETENFKNLNPLLIVIVEMLYISID